MLNETGRNKNTILIVPHGFLLNCVVDINTKPGHREVGWTPSYFQLLSANVIKLMEFNRSW